VRVLRNIAVAATSLIVFFALAEAGARLAGFHPKRVPAPMFSWLERGELYTMKPNRNWVMPGDLKLVRVNSLGLRGPEIAPKGLWKRIVLLGDSVAFGYDVAEKKALAARLRRSFSNRGVPLEVVSAAIPGWCARQHRLFLEQHGPSLRPDLVLATVVLNDLPELQKGQAELRASVESANALNWLAERSGVAVAVRQALAASDNPFERPASVRQLATDSDSEESQRSMALEFEELRGLAAAARAQDIPLALVILPFRFQLEEADSDGPQKQLKAFAKSEGIWTLDLLPTLRRSSPESVFLDQVHLSERGNEIVANKTAAWILRHRLIDPAGPPRALAD